MGCQDPFQCQLHSCWCRNAGITVLPWPQVLHPTARREAKRIDTLLHMPEHSRERLVLANFTCLGCQRKLSLDSS